MAAEQGSLGAGHEICGDKIIVKLIGKHRLHRAAVHAGTISLRNVSLQPTVKLADIFATAQPKTGCNLSEQAV